jgi:hypothetical protein
MMLRSLGMGAAALTAFMAIGCGDSATPDAVGGLYFSLISASSTDAPPGTSCGIAPHSAQIGTVPPSVQSHGSLVTNGENGASVSCAVGDGTTIKIRGNLTKGTVAFVVQGSVEKGGKGTAKVLENDPASVAQFESPDDKPCNVYVDTPPLVAGGEKMWVRMDCPLLVDRDKNHYCAADGTSVFYFDHCD